MRVESLTSRLEFNERRARALESVVVYKPPDENERTPRRPTRRRRRQAASPAASAPAAAQPSARRRSTSEGPGQRSRRRRRRRGRRGGGLGVHDHGRRRRCRRRPSSRTPTRGARCRSGESRRGRRRHIERAIPSESSPGPDDLDEPGPDEAVKLAVVVQRYGQAINGGAELHARYIAEHLARHAEVEVLTTCATDYVTWRNELPAGVETVNGVPVRRFPRRARTRYRSIRPALRARLQQAAFDRRRARLARRRRADQPGARRLHRRSTPRATTICIFFSYRYYHAYHGARAAAPRARSWCRRPSATRRSACRSSRRFSAASARSCTTRPKSGR